MSREYYEESRENSSRKPNRFIIFLVALLIIATLAIIIVSNYKKRHTYTSYEDLGGFNVPVASKYIRYGDGFVRYTSDGAEASCDGKSLWNFSYDLKRPIADVCGDYCVIADRGGNEIRITDGKGGNNKIVVSDKIVDVRIASQGVIAVWTGLVEKDHIYLYSADGTMLLDLETSVNSNGFPTAMDLSEDGKKLVVAFAKFENETQSWVTFYNFDGVGQNRPDRIVGSFEYPDQIIPDIRFVDNSCVAVFYENGCTLYSMKEVPTEIKSYGMERLKAIANDSEHICMASNEADGTTSFTIMDKNGNVSREITTGITFGGMYIEEDELIVYNDTSLIIYYLDGEEKFRSQITGGMRNIYPAGKDKYTIINMETVSTIQLKTE